MDEGKRAQLEELRRKPKFVDEPGTIYNAMRPENVRLSAEQEVNGLIDLLIGSPGDAPKRNEVLAAMARALKRFPGSDTEDCERMCHHMREIFDVLGIESSDGLLMRWRYGWLLGTLAMLTPGTRR